MWCKVVLKSYHSLSTQLDDVRCFGFLAFPQSILIYHLPPLSILPGSFYTFSTVLLDVYSTYFDSQILIIYSWEGADTLSVEIAYVYQITIFRPTSTYS